MLINIVTDRGSRKGKVSENELIYCKLSAREVLGKGAGIGA